MLVVGRALTVLFSCTCSLTNGCDLLWNGKAVFFLKTSHCCLQAYAVRRGHGRIPQRNDEYSARGNGRQNEGSRLFFRFRRPRELPSGYVSFRHYVVCAINSGTTFRMTCICLEMLPDENGKIGNGDTQNTCPGMTAWCLNWPSGTTDWLHHTTTNGLTIAVDGAGRSVMSQQSLYFPANMTFHFGKWQRMGNTGEEWFEVRHLSSLEQICV